MSNADIDRIVKENADVDGVQALADVTSAWEAGSTKGEKAAVCKKIQEGLTKAADTSHDLFNGLRLFARNCEQAVEKDEEAALDKALGLGDRFVKAVVRIEKKIQAQQTRAVEMKEAAEKAAAKAKEDAEKAAEASDDSDDFDDDDSASGDDDEF